MKQSYRIKRHVVSLPAIFAFTFLFSVLIAQGGSVIPSARAATRNVVDQPDDITGNQVHILYVLPSDGTDRALDANGDLATSVTAFMNWLSLQTGGRKLKLDSYQGSIDITFVRLKKTNSEMKGSGTGWPNGIPYLRNRIEDELSAAGFSNAQKIYAVYYDGGSDYACGGAAYPPTVPGRVTAMYLGSS